MRIAHQMHAPALSLRPRKQPRVRRDLRRTGDAQFEAEAHGRVDPRRAHVVARTRPHHRLAGDRSAMLLEGHNVGHQLAGMRLVGEPVDDGNRRRFRQLDQALMPLRAQHDRVDITRQHARGVADGFAVPELQIAAAQHHRLAAHLAHADVERDARARRRFLEDQRQHPPFERLHIVGSAPRFALARRLHAFRVVDQMAQRRRIERVEIEEVLRRHHSGRRVHFAASLAD